MNVITLTEPWASLVVGGEKRWETRSWSTKYRGLIAIHAAKGFPRWARDLCLQEPFRSALGRMGYGGLALADPAKAFPLGHIIGSAVIEDVLKTEAALTRYVIEGTNEEQFGDYSFGRFAWKFGPIVDRLADPIPAKGALGIWRFDG